MDARMDNIGSTTGGFVGTAHPSEITTEDAINWCNELAQYIRDNPTDTGAWVKHSLYLYRRLEAIAIITQNGAKFIKD